jgi:hypothetical protein
MTLALLRWLARFRKMSSDTLSGEESGSNWASIASFSPVFQALEQLSMLCREIKTKSEAWSAEVPVHGKMWVAGRGSTGTLVCTVGAEAD